MKFLADANVLSEATKPRPSARVMEWWQSNDSQVAVNPIVLGELEFGILKLPKGRRRTLLKEWFENGVKTLPVLDIDARTAQIWAALLTELKAKGRTMPVKDSLIAASARQHELTVVTRNVDDFRHACSAVTNPFEP